MAQDPRGRPAAIRARGCAHLAAADSGQGRTQDGVAVSVHQNLHEAAGRALAERGPAKWWVQVDRVGGDALGEGPHRPAVPGVPASTGLTRRSGVSGQIELA